MIDAATRRLVRHRAEDRCEYCRLPQSCSPLAPLHVEHIIPRKHGGSDEPENLALACLSCNLRKGCNLTGIDPASGLVVELFHPRRQKWEEHFRREGLRIAGTTPAGRTTVRVLELNSEHQLLIREAAMLPDG